MHFKVFVNELFGDDDVIRFEKLVLLLFEISTVST